MQEEIYEADVYQRKLTEKSIKMYNQYFLVVLRTSFETVAQSLFKLGSFSKVYNEIRIQ